MFVCYLIWQSHHAWEDHVFGHLLSPARLKIRSCYPRKVLSDWLHLMESPQNTQTQTSTPQAIDTIVLKK